MKITEVNLSDSGGAFSLIYAIQNSMYNCGITDVVFDYFSMGKFEKADVIANIERMGGKIYSADLRHNRLLGFIKLPILFYKYCKENEVEAVHIHCDNAYVLQLYSISAKVAGVSYIIAHSHCAGMNGDFRKIKKLLHFFLRPFIGNSANVYLSCSDLATEWMYIGKLRKKAIILKNGVNTSKYRFDEIIRKKCRQDLGIEDDTIALAAVGDLGYQKNPIFICDVMKKLDDKYRLFFIGDGSCKQEVEKYAVESGLSEKVIFLGKRNVSEVLNAMDIFVMPSRFEGLPVSGVEAQANGLPCIFSAEITRQVGILSSSIFERIDSVETWGNSIKSIRLNTEERCDAAEVVRQAGFDIRDTADYLYKIYKEL